MSYIPVELARWMVGADEEARTRIGFGGKDEDDRSTHKEGNDVCEHVKPNKFRGETNTWRGRDGDLWPSEGRHLGDD